ncbi:Major facilitator superfamily transporter [Cordyceps javanica]|uniref:Major facilitator superfamily transporter n=1 Tax=Cordyceps javanica TaxID=43265 RepID=A0A545VXX7_9HYPO|nr:Major facilitator superfamily transporter [Cordyceps javanica]TQW06578.1 Major facilitator superfamily transporter [Cordyceps javanica]
MNTSVQNYVTPPRGRQESTSSSHSTSGSREHSESDSASSTVLEPAEPAQPGTTGGTRHEEVFTKDKTQKEVSIVSTRKDTPFHVYSKRVKWYLVIIVGIAGLFSGLSSNIYLPSLSAIAQDLKVSPNDVELTITSYLVVQGNGVIQDIATPDERGSFISFYQAIRNFSIAVGPIIGGILANFLGFRSVFVFLLIASCLVLTVIVTILPETLRSIAGNGSRKLTGIYRPLLSRVVLGEDNKEQPKTVKPRPKVTWKTFLEPLLLLREKDIFVSLIFGGTVYSVWSIVVATTTGLFGDLFHLNDLLLGVIFLPNGLGTIVGSVIAGKLMTREFLAAEKAYLGRNPTAAPPSKNKKDLPNDFAIEHARLRHVPWITVLFIVSTAAYGFTVLQPSQLAIVSKPGWIAVPLMLQFMIAATSNAVFAINTTLVADLCPGKAASSTAVNNLLRCGMGALGVAFGDLMLEKFGSAATFLGLGILTTGMSVFLIAELLYGMKWRKARRQRAAQS